MSNQGVRVDPDSMPAGERALLSENGYSTDVRFLGRRGDTRFYIGTGASSGARCYLTGRAVEPAPHFGVLACTSDFPTDEQPILDYSAYSQGLNDPYPSIDRLAGFAADGIAEVGVRTAAGQTTWIPVVNNIYGAGSFGPVAGVLARDDEGTIVYRRIGRAMTLAEAYGR